MRFFWGQWGAQVGQSSRGEASEAGALLPLRKILGLYANIRRFSLSLFAGRIRIEKRSGQGTDLVVIGN